MNPYTSQHNPYNFTKQNYYNGCILLATIFTVPVTKSLGRIRPRLPLYQTSKPLLHFLFPVNTLPVCDIGSAGSVWLTPVSTRGSSGYAAAMYSSFLLLLKPQTTQENNTAYIDFHRQSVKLLSHERKLATASVKSIHTYSYTQALQTDVSNTSLSSHNVLEQQKLMVTWLDRPIRWSHGRDRLES